MSAGQALDLAFNYFAGVITAWRTPQQVVVQGSNSDALRDGHIKTDGNPGLGRYVFAQRFLGGVGAVAVLLAAARFQGVNRDAQCSGLEASSSDASQEEDFEAICKTLGCSVLPSTSKPLDVDVLLTERGQQAVRVADALQRRFVELSDKMRTIRRSTEAASPAQQRLAAIRPALTAFRELAAFEPASRKTLTTIATYAETLRELAFTGDWSASEQLERLPIARGGLRARLLEAVREARTLAPLVLWSRSVDASKALACSPGLLLGVEDLATAAEGDVGGPMPGEDDVAARFDLGLYLSEIGISAHEETATPFFDAADVKGGLGVTAIQTVSSAVSWVADARGSHVPAAIARAEELLQQGEEMSVGQDRGDRAAARALRLYRHAKLLVAKHHDSAAEWRYRTAASLAMTHAREKLASHALTRLAYFLMLRGRQRDALIAADEALVIHADPLARYLSATLRRTLGELRTNADVLRAKQDLVDIRGQLPSKDLEKLRATAEVDLEVWGHITANLAAMDSGEPAPARPSVGFFKATCACLTTGDVSQTLICLAGWCLFC